MPEESPITLRYLDVDQLCAGLPDLIKLAPPARLKDQALAELRIPRQPDKTHLQSWVLQMALENGLPQTLPQYEIGDAALTSGPAVSKFVWFLA